MTLTDIPAQDDLPRRPLDWMPMALVPAVMIAALPFVGSPSTWLTLSIAGLAMGVIIFMISSGLMLVFGLMDVMNFGHGAFITLGAYVGLTMFAPLTMWIDSTNLALNLLVLAFGFLAAVIVAGAVGLVFDRVLIRPVYGNHLKQILITMGGFIVVEQLIRAIWGTEVMTLSVPVGLRGSVFIGDAAIERYRILALVVGVCVFGVMLLILNKTRIGLQIRAGVEDRDMLEAMGYRTKHLFVAVFVAGAMLAGMGGLMWGLYQQNFTPAIGSQANVLIFIVIIIGGLGSTTGCMIAALLVGLTSNYAGFAEPKIALFSNIILMLLVLLWRPQGLYAVVNR